MRNIDLSEAVVREAREWLGTPYRHQARLRGVGVDCVGLIVGVGLATGALIGFDDAAFSPFKGYGRLPHPERMGEAMRRFLCQIETPRPGDIAWIEWRSSLPMHLAILAEADGRATMIHATNQIGRVVEHGFVAPWPGMVDSWWRYPALMDSEV